MTWLKEVFQVKKPVIAMCHLQALPGDPGYKRDKGIEWVMDLSLIHISEPTRHICLSRMPSSA